jgi:hypothetical protein
VSRLKVLSLGAGVQSSALLLMACEGEIEKPDHAIFADTQSEPQAVYDWLERLEGWSSIPIHRVTAGSLEQDVLRSVQISTRVAQPPLFVRNAKGVKGILRRACTRDYKVVPIERYIKKELLKGENQTVERWFGISLDEVHRMKQGQPPFVNRYPLVERKMTRHDCQRWLESHGYPLAPRSACYFCPYHSNDFWRRMKKQEPKEWAKAVKFDAAIRSGPRGVRGETFLHASLKPLGEIDLSSEEERGQGSLFGEECEGMCGV